MFFPIGNNKLLVNSLCFLLTHSKYAGLMIQWLKETHGIKWGDSSDDG